MMNRSLMLRSVPGCQLRFDHRNMCRRLPSSIRSSSSGLIASASASACSSAINQESKLETCTMPRQFSNSSSEPSTSFEYEYPTRTERPTITRTLASSLTNSSSSKQPNSRQQPQQQPQPPSPFDEAFDKTSSLSSEQRSSILQSQRSILNTRLPSSFRIEAVPPTSIPNNLPPDSLSKPSTQISTLDNGIRIASQETYGQVCTFGLISNCGSRLEETTEHTTGINHLMELLAFCGTDTLDSTSYQNKLDTLGGVSFASSSREQFLYCIDVLRPNIDEAMNMLQDVVLKPKIDDVVVDEMKRVIEFQWMDMMPEILVSEGLQIAAYGPYNDGGGLQQQQQLGKYHFCKFSISKKNLEHCIIKC